MIHKIVTCFANKTESLTPAIFAQTLGASHWPVVTLKQTHSADVICVERAPEESQEIGVGDALITNLSGVVLAVKTADCLPVLISDSVIGVVAAVHAGWKGLAAAILSQTLQVMREKYFCHLENLKISFGPCISAQNYEVGLDMISAVESKLGKRYMAEQKPDGKFHFDLQSTAVLELASCGILANQIIRNKNCTFAQREEFCSYRRDGSSNPGRQLSGIAIAVR